MVTDTTPSKQSFVAHDLNQSSLKPTQQQSQGSKERRKRNERTPMQMIDNSLTVDIEQDM